MPGEVIDWVHALAWCNPAGGALAFGWHDGVEIIDDDDDLDDLHNEDYIPDDDASTGSDDGTDHANDNDGDADGGQTMALLSSQEWMMMTMMAIPSKTLVTTMMTPPSPAKVSLTTLTMTAMALTPARKQEWSQKEWRQKEWHQRE